ncbi:rCG28341 [Rattus norvegicus]|uniref:RCG28341 n=1 Tax=Rattus norvegicus TaxID=10116 RepID=A6IET6_RAT|nr:rCG28341 [Rattus norvegicus]
MVGDIPEPVVLGPIRRLAEQARGSKPGSSTPPWSVSAPASSSCLSSCPA